MSKSKSRRMLKDWGFFNRLSNRRLSVRATTTPLEIDYKLDWSIDRITIVGNLAFDPDQLGKWLISVGWAKEAFKGYQMIGDYDENLAYFEQVRFHPEKGRIDFNPNKISGRLEEPLKQFIHKLFIEPHFSRADVACDIYNLPDDLMIQYQIVEPLKTQKIYGKAGDLQTIYWGSRSSEKQVRQYNKLIEQRRKGELIPSEIQSWWRLEMQLRWDKANNFSKVASDTLSNYCAPTFMPLDIKLADKAMILALHDNHELWDEMSRHYRYKIRDLMKEIAKEDNLTKELIKSFSEYQDKIKNELDEWIRGIDVTYSANEDEFE